MVSSNANPTIAVSEFSVAPLKFQLLGVTRSVNLICIGLNTSDIGVRADNNITVNNQFYLFKKLLLMCINY